MTLHYNTLHYIYITLHHTTLHYITLHYITAASGLGPMPGVPRRSQSSSWVSPWGTLQVGGQRAAPLSHLMGPRGRGFRRILVGETVPVLVPALVHM